jgi:hypothetical protein
MSDLRKVSRAREAGGAGTNNCHALAGWLGDYIIYNVTFMA